MAGTGRRAIAGYADGLLIGGHMSAAGGLYRALERGAEHGFTAIQVFLKSPNQWQCRPLSNADVQLYRETLARAKTPVVVAHNAYLINLASPDEELRERSIRAMLDEVDRAALMGIPVVVTHLGAHTGAGEKRGLELLTESLNRIAEARPDSPVRIALETTAGQGTTLGGRFEHIARVRSRVEAPERVAACFDTCHVHAAGRDMTTERATGEVWESFDRTVGIDHLAVLHLNDSKRERGSRVDRHEHIGEGQLGLAPFRWIMNSRTLWGVPKIVETPDMDSMHPVNVERLRGLVEHGSSNHRGRIARKGGRGRCRPARRGPGKGEAS